VNWSVFGRGDQHKVLTDIMGMEDYLGDMDFKLAATRFVYIVHAKISTERLTHVNFNVFRKEVSIVLFL
jgi:polyribonucleotide nucleotidyltransferase